MTTSELDSRNIALSVTSMRKSVENLVISSQDAIGQSISQALTFSGVIAHHSNQTIPENRSVSRSPSPSLRITDTGADVIDNDKLSQTSDSSVHPHGDSGSLSSGEAVTVVSAPTNKQDHNKSSTPNPTRGGEGPGRTKKKSWYNSLYPTYKSKSDDFKRLFKDLPDDERLIVDYSCALQKDILAHGRLYASQNYLCFYASIFGWETSLSLRWKDVTAITKEKTALVIPNAILVCTEGEKHFLASFSGRDKAYLMLFRVWQNALMDQPMTSHEIWQWVHSCYGEELGFNSDDEGYSRGLVDEQPALGSLQTDTASEELIYSCMDARDGSAEPREDIRGHHTRDSSPPLVTNGETEYREEGGDTLPTDMSDTSDSEPDKPANGRSVDKCSDAHEGKLLLRQEFPFNIDQLFTMIFTNSKFNLELLAARAATDYVQAPWQPQGALKCRQISYTLGLTAGPVGPKEVQVTETQIMNKCSVPGCLYSINCTSDNCGIPYADYFSVVVHYCLSRVSHTTTALSLHAHVKYKKSMWPIVKAFLEKNTMGGIEEFARLLEARLTAEAERAVPLRKARRHRRVAECVPASSQEAGAVAAGPGVGPRGLARGPRGLTRGPPPAAGASHTWLVGALVLLLAINALLLYRLYSDRGYTLDVDDLQNRLKSSGLNADSAEWSRALQQQAARQHAQLAAWRAALARAVAHLAQTEQALTKLLETIKPSLEKAQQEAEARHEL